MKRFLPAILVILLACDLSIARAQETPSLSEKYFTDTELINQDGKKVRFFSDVLKGKTVVINVFFTTCTGSCPVMNKGFETIQEGLGEHLGKDVRLVSITVDPVTDTPAKLKEYAKRFNAKPGWIFLTGTKENVETILKKLGNNVTDKNDHSNIVTIGNEHTGLWKKAFGMAKPEELLKVIESVMNDK